MKIRNSIDAFKALYKKLSGDKYVGIAKEYITKYYRQASACAVVLALGIVCAGTAVSNASKNDNQIGLIMSVSNVSAGQKAFSGNTFEVASISYNEMMDVTYQTEQLAQLEKSEKQIEEILASREQSRREKAAIDELTAQETATTTEDKANVPVSTYIEQTLADENGDYEFVGDFILTAYCPCPICCGAYSNMANPTTASGTRATAGRTIAADTSRFPFGTRLMINGQIYVVEDVGGAVKGNHIDIYCNSHQEAINFGRRSAQVYVVR